MGAALIVGRTPRKLDDQEIVGGSEELYAAQRLDEATVSGQVFEHCTFANIGFKSAHLRRCKFLNCAFIDCYFRHTSIENCNFTGCKFVDCNFLEPNLVDNTFKFIEFRGCFIPFEYFGDCLPLDPGLRHGLADELVREAGAAGALGDARRYRLLGEKAFEKHQWNLAWASGGEYYEKHRPPLDRARAVLKWCGRKFNRWLWGYGERGVILARSFLATALIFAVALRVFVSTELSHGGHQLSTSEYILLSLDNLLAGTGFSQVSVSGAAARWLVGGEVFVGLMFIGLFVTLVFNWIRRR
jgi:hypothetical protein